ncbi:MAG: hypothetical protein ABI813_13375 [Bacteroidota bacterium]
MMQKVRLNNVKKNKKVLLTKELPITKSFGNRNPVPKDARGDVTSEGFVGGMLNVKFYTHLHGTENTRFNELSAADYLLTDNI